MGEKIIVGRIDKGLKNSVTPFNIDNDSFPVLINAYQWRGRIKRKRGTSFLNRLTRFFNSTNASYSSTATFALVAGAGNILVNASWTLQTNGNIVPGSVTIVNTTVPQTYTDAAMDGTLSGNLGGTGTINYSTGAITITGGAGNSVSATFRYYPDLPVMGLEELILEVNQFPGTLAFDTKYSYNILKTFPYNVYDVSFYKNPAADPVTLPGYVQKTVWTPTTWNGQDYQQFWTVNYQGALWATNGINVPFSANNIGMQFNTITAVGGIVAGPPAFATITTATNHGLSIGDFVFINEIVGMTGINFQTGYVTAIPAPNQITVEFPFATIGGAWASGGIVQYLTNRSDTTKDCIRFYDGDPTNGSATAPVLNGVHGWVNFMPPLSQSSFSIGNLPAAQYYLVGARMIVPFKDRLLFIGPVIQTSTGSPKYLQDTVIYSQNGTAYYTASFTGDPSLSSTIFHPILVPDNQIAAPNAYWVDQTGFGGFITAGIDQPILTCVSNEDVLIFGLSNSQTRFVYTGNDIIPFNFFTVNSELGSSSTFSAINMDKGAITRGDNGIIITSQNEARRIDEDILDEVFEMNMINNGAERITAQRDFINEWIYLTYVGNDSGNAFTYFPNQTLLFNYRDNSWAVFKESYTTYGSFRKQTGFTWATVGTVYPTWSSWTAPWSAGASTLLQPEVIAGNHQGFVVVRDEGTDESNSLYIRDISSSVVTSPDHNLSMGDYIIISGAIGTVASQVNDKIFTINTVTQNTFVLNPLITSGTYVGGGVIKKIYRPFIQTKQFPVSWSMARKTRLGPQQYLLTATSNSQIQLLIFLSQDPDNGYNNSPIVPNINSSNNSLVYSSVLYTCPESTNLGLTPANINLNMVTAARQSQIWHRMNTSLIGDTVQIGFTLSDEQLRNADFEHQFSEIELHGFILDVSPSQMLA